MLGRRPDPGLFGSTSLLDLDLLNGTIYWQLAREGRQLFTDYQFRAIYSKVGRPSASPALMALACLLQHHEGVSDDTVIERDGVTVLVDPMSFQYLAGSEVDYTEGLEGSRFVVNNPNAATTCGCGSSFSV